MNLQFESRLAPFGNANAIAFISEFCASEEVGDEDDGLKDAASDEEEYVREILRKELGREPTTEDIDEWIRQQTESF